MSNGGKILRQTLIFFRKYLSDWWERYQLRTPLQYWMYVIRTYKKTTRIGHACA